MSNNQVVYKEPIFNLSNKERIQKWSADRIRTVEDPFWGDSPSILLRRDRWIEFFPSGNMTLAEQLNAISRFSLILGMVLTIWNYRINYLFLPITILLTTYIIYWGHKHDTNERERYRETPQKDHEHLTDYIVQGEGEYPVEYVEPTIDNPFMNVMPFDQVLRPNRESVSKLNVNITPKLNDAMNDKFNYNLYKDADDVFDRRNSQRQFYTMPVTTIPNEQGKFAHWLYKTGPTCKEQNGYQCMRNLGEGRVRPGRF